MSLDIDTWHPGLAFAFLLAPFVIALSGVAVGVFIACSRHFNTMLSAFPKSTWARQQNILGTTSLASRCYLVSTLSGTLLFAQYLVFAWLVIVGMAWLLLAAGLFKLTES